MKLNKTRLVSAVSLLLTIITVWLFLPIYGFFAHKGNVPLPPWGWQVIPENAPSNQVLYDDGYIEEAAHAMQLVSLHRQTINAPALSAAVAINGKLVWAGATGWADIKAGKAATPDTQFRIGSTSKPLTISALARLDEADQVDLDAPLVNLLPDLPNSAWAQMTPRQLASHSSGLPEYKKTSEWYGLYRIMTLNKHYNDVKDSLELFDQAPLQHIPGAGFEYSSYNTVLLSAALQSATGTPFIELMQAQVFAPLAMNSTTADNRNLHNLATFYIQKNAKVRPWREVDLSHRLAGGGFVSTPSDLVRMGSGWLNPDFLNSATRERFWQPQRLASGEVNPQNYALGWRRHEGDKEIPTNMNHGGVSRGAQCWLMVIPEHHMAIALSVNTTTEVFWDFAQIAPQIATIFQPVASQL